MRKREREGEEDGGGSESKRWKGGVGEGEQVGGWEETETKKRRKRGWLGCGEGGWPVEERGRRVVRKGGMVRI